MKRILLFAITLVLILSLMLTAGCAGIPSIEELGKKVEDLSGIDVLDASKPLQGDRMSDCVLTIREGTTYSVCDMEFELSSVEETPDGSEPEDATAEGKWVTVSLKMIDGSYDGETGETIKKNILLDGYETHEDLSIQALLSGGSITDYYFEIYFDVPEEYDVDSAVVYGTDSITEASA